MALTPEQNAVELELVRRYEKKVTEQGEDTDLWGPYEELICSYCEESVEGLINDLCFQCDEDLHGRRCQAW